MEDVAKSSGSEIYCGDELQHALERSSISNNILVDERRTRFELISHIARDLRNSSLRELLPRAYLVTGIERDSGDEMTLGFHGTSRIADFWANHMLGGSSFERTRVAAPRAAKADVLVSDHVLASPFQRRGARIRIPAWVRQKMSVARDWAATLSQLRRGQRQEIGRFLRRHRYSIDLSTGRDAMRSYYRDLHRPYLAGRFGDSMITASEDGFVDQFQYMTRLDLIADGEVVAASVLERRASNLMIRASSMQLSRPELHGRADTLDYFSLLIAQLLGCTILDFGLSRPHLDNGSLQYKAKWGAKLSPTGDLKADVCVIPRKENEATLAFLRRNYFLQHDGRDFFVRVLADQENEKRRIDKLMSRFRPIGLARVETITR